MIRLNRTTEYGLMALRYISGKGGAEARASAREIADAYGIPFEITAKTLMRLKDAGLIASSQGARGGYRINRSMKEVTLAEFLGIMEGPQFLVTCATELGTSTEAECEYRPRCDIQHVMGELNGRILGFFSGIRLSELTDPARVLPSYARAPAEEMRFGEEP
ncbi:MAG TPA: Rrf2 family transcriptional regulator [Bdellovibrionota bacterium]|nr:Rrf2 family transcriptional regulator [Bdellovibrionota bacterium]